jgi:hypothetical protein
MREVEVSRFVRGRPAELDRELTPETAITYEGSFVVRNVEEREDGWVVTAGGRGLEMELVFEDREDGLYYEQRGDAGPLDEMWTRISYEPKDDGAVVTARSGVSLGLPLPAVTDRIAAWKRRGELKRALGQLAAAFD